MLVSRQWRAPTFSLTHSLAVLARCTRQGGLRPAPTPLSSAYLVASRSLGTTTKLYAPNVATSTLSWTAASKDAHTDGVTAAPDPSFKGCTDPEDPVLNYPYLIVDTTVALAACAQKLSTATEVAVDVEALVTSGDASTHSTQLGPLSLVQLCSDAAPQIFLIDVLAIGIGPFTDAMGPLFTNASVRKYFFDCRRDVEALSCQAHIRTRGVVDLQLYYTALQWRLRSVNRLSNMPYVLKAMTNLDRRDTDSAVHLAMTCGGRPVWDVRPLPRHFLDYAADDVRHTFLLRAAFAAAACDAAPPLGTSAPVSVGAVARLTEHYVAAYATGVPVQDETDPRPAEVNAALLERFIGPGGVCAFCGARGHVATECFQKKHTKNVGDSASHSNTQTSREAVGRPADGSRPSAHRYPQLLKCAFCARLGHNEQNCFKKHPCEHCGGEHQSALCRHRLRTVPFFDFQKKTK